MKYLVLADVHANLAALEAVLERESDWDRLLFLGDAVDAGPRPDAVLSALSDCPGTFICGNHDRAVLDAPPDAPPPGSRDVTRWTSARLSPDSREFLASFARTHRLRAGDAAVRLHHGDFAFEGRSLDWDGRVWPDTDRGVFRALAERYDASAVAFGHSHVQFATREDGTLFVNPGSVGQHRLGSVAACYAVLDGGEFRLKACEYDADRTVEALESLPLDDDYLEARKRVYTEGVLPDDMRDFAPLRAAGYR